MREALDGLLLVDKPSGPTSHDVVDAVRRATGLRRVGHAGTLDPMACGLLPLVLGRATRLVRYLPQEPKDYTGSLRLGLTTETDDVTGKLLRQCAGELPNSARVLDRARRFEGSSHQVPPAISARKVLGRRLYRLNRRGPITLGAAVAVRVFRFELRPTAEPDLYEFEASVSTGTYIRALARDLGAELGCGAVLASLRRTAIGPLRPAPDLRFTEELMPDAGELRRALVPLDRLPLAAPALRLESGEDVRRFCHGLDVAVSEAGPTGAFSVLAADGSLLGVGERAAGVVRPKVVVRTAG